MVLPLALIFPDSLTGTWAARVVPAAFSGVVVGGISFAFKEKRRFHEAA